MNLSDILGEDPFSRENKRALDDWRQGDLVAGARLFWGAPCGDDPITDYSTACTHNDVNQTEDPDSAPSVDDHGAVVGGGAADKAHPWVSVTPEPSDGTSLGDIASQTCDVGGTGPGARHATVQACPAVCLTELVDSGAFDNGAITEIRRHERLDYVYLTRPLDDGEWAVDLRMSMPVSKGVLLGQARRSAFATETDALQFSERVAGSSVDPRSMTT